MLLFLKYIWTENKPPTTPWKLFALRCVRCVALSQTPVWTHVGKMTSVIQPLPQSWLLDTHKSHINCLHLISSLTFVPLSFTELVCLTLKNCGTLELLHWKLLLDFASKTHYSSKLYCYFLLRWNNFTSSFTCGEGRKAAMRAFLEKVWRKSGQRFKSLPSI